MVKTSIFLSILFFISAPAHGGFEAEKIYAGTDGAEVSLPDVAARIAAGDIVVLGEIHDNVRHHQNQKKLLHELATVSPSASISVGMEFFEFPLQPDVDRYLTNELDEESFLQKIGWGGFSFDFYRDLVLFPLSHGGWTYALNAPRTLTQKISRQGLDSLNEDERKLLPEDFTLGDDAYLERFREAMGGHVPQEKLLNYFAAQSAWDEAMAATAVKIMSANPEQVLVIIVGDFHAQYGGGLPDRLRARGSFPVKVISQVDLSGLSEEEKEREILPHSRWGTRADWVWTSLR